MASNSRERKSTARPLYPARAALGHGKRWRQHTGFHTSSSSGLNRKDLISKADAEECVEACLCCFRLWVYVCTQYMSLVHCFPLAEHIYISLGKQFKIGNKIKRQTLSRACKPASRFARTGGLFSFLFPSCIHLLFMTIFTPYP